MLSRLPAQHVGYQFALGRVEIVVVQEKKKRRPDPARWVWYAFGGRLGPRYRDWVLHDLTGPTRWARQVARAIVPLVPITLVLILLLGSSWITWAALLGGLLMALIYSAAYIDQSAERRLVAHGYPPGTAAAVRGTRDPATEAERIRRYNAAYRNDSP